jgi:hypothetical protein
MILKHTHQLKRVKGTKDIYNCADPHCTYKENKIFLVGKASLCNECRGEIVLTSEDLKRSKPLCLNCSNTKEAIAYRKIRDNVKMLIPEEQKEETTNA